MITKLPRFFTIPSQSQGFMHAFLIALPPFRRYSPNWIVLAIGQERNLRYWGERDNVDSQEGTKVIAATSDTASTRRNGTDSSCHFAQGIKNYELSQLAGEGRLMSTNHFSRCGNRSSWLCTIFIAALVSLPPV